MFISHYIVLPIQVDSRGVIHDEFGEFHQNYFPQKVWQQLLIEVVVTTIEESHCIWCNCNRMNEVTSSSHNYNISTFFSVMALY